MVKILLSKIPTICIPSPQMQESSDPIVMEEMAALSWVLFLSWLKFEGMKMYNRWKVKEDSKSAQCQIPEASLCLKLALMMHFKYNIRLAHSKRAKNGFLQFRENRI